MNTSVPRGWATLAWTVRALSAAGAVALVAVPAFYWRDPEWVRAAATAQLGLDGATLVLDDTAMLYGALANLPTTLLSLYGLWQLWQLFGHFATGRVFAPTALAHFRRFAWVVMLEALLLPLDRALSSVALTLNRPPGQRLLVFSLSWSDYQLVLLGAVLLAIATVLARAAQIAAENEGFV